MSEQPQKKLLVVDGNSLTHRAFHAIPLLSNGEGVFTNAAFGFTTMLLKVLQTEKPAYAVVAFDKGKITFRHEVFEAYKGHRKATPEELRPQFALIKQILRAMRIEVCELEGYEADDLIGTLVTQAEVQGFTSLIVTGDRDAFQLISADTKVMLTRKGISQLEVFDLKRLWAQYNLVPRQMVDVKSLMGDSSDNIPGVPGIGEKTAVKLIRQYDSLEKLLEHLHELPPQKVYKNLAAYADQARLSKHLGAIDCQAPVDVDWAQCVYQKPDYAKLLKIFQELDFQSLIPPVLRELKQEGVPAVQQPAAVRDICLVSKLNELEHFLHQARRAGELALAVTLSHRDYLRAEVRALGLAFSGDQACGIVLEPESKGCTRAELRRVLEPVFTDPGMKLYFHDIKAAVTALHRLGLQPVPPAGDMKIAAYLLNPTASGYELVRLCLEYLNTVLVEKDHPGEEVACCAACIYQLSRVLHDKLVEADMVMLYEQVELPLALVLARMEQYGVAVDKQQLQAMGMELQGRIEKLTAEIYRQAGEVFNINSPKQLSGVLFEKLKLPVKKRTKTGFSTSASVLEELATEHEIVVSILEFRHLVKLKSTYVEGLSNLINPVTGKLHTTLNQTVTATGRLSSTEPNLQNIPVRLEHGRRIRKVFVPSGTDYLLLAADYSQIELRILAHLSGDERLINAFGENGDIHSYTAAEAFGVPVTEVSFEMRHRAKTINFGLVYGMSDFGLAQDLGISRREAQEYIERYFRRYHGVQDYLHQVVERARQDGYVTTILNRRRYLPELFSPNRKIRDFAERTAKNTPIQGSAADIIKLAMIKADTALEAQGLSAKMILQVHDELIFDVPVAELERVVLLVKEAMEYAYPLRVPLCVEIKAGPNWYNLKEITIDC